MADGRKGIQPVPDALARLDQDGFLTQIRKFIIDLNAGRIAALAGEATSASTGAPAPAPGPPGPAGPPGTPYTPDLTPPPTPSGVIVSAGLDFVFITTDAPTFLQGNGYQRTIVYGVTYGGAGPLPTFGDAVLVHEFVGQVGSFAAEPGVQWHIWLKWLTNDDVESVSPQGGANGNEVTTAKIGNVHLGPLIVEAANLANGSVTASKVASAAIDLTKFASGIEPVGVVGALPSPIGYTGPKTVLLTTDGKLYRYSGGAWTRAVDGADLVANSVTTGSIAAGAIGAQQIAANAITTDKLLVTGRGAALSDDPAMLDSTAWTLFSGNVGLFTTIPDGTVGSGVLRSGTPGSFGSWYNGARRVAFDPAKTYRIRARARRDATANGTLFVGVALFDNAGANIAGDGTQWFYPVSAVTATTGWTIYTAEFGAGTAKTFPSNGRTMAPLVILNYSSTIGYMEVQDLRIEEKVGADLIVDGSIIATKLAANSIVVGTAAIQNGAIVNAMMATASITNANVVSLAASKLTAGSIAVGEYIQSSDFVTGISGWRMGGNTAEIGSASIRGQLTAAQIDTRGMDIRDASGSVIFSAGSSLDFASRFSAGTTGVPSNYANRGDVGGYVNSDPLLLNPSEWLVPPGINYAPTFGAGNGLVTAWNCPTGIAANVFSADFPVSEFKTYVVESSIYLFGANTNRFYLLVAFYDVSGNVLTASSGWPDLGTYNYYLSNANLPSGATRTTFKFGALGAGSIPVGAVRARVGVLGNYASAGTTPWAWGGAQVREVVDGTTLAITPGNASTYIANAAIAAAQIGSLNADVINAGSIRGINVNSSSHTTKGSYLTAATSGGATTVSVKDTTDFAASGSAVVFDSTNDRDSFSYTGKTSTSLTGCSGVLAHNIGATILPFAKTMAMDAVTNEMRFYGDRGDGTIEELASIGINAIGGDSIIGNFGSSNPGNIRIALYGRSYNAQGVVGQSNGDAGGLFISGTYVGVSGFSFGGFAGVLGESSSGVGGQFNNNATRGNLLLSARAGRPSDVAAPDQLCMIYTTGGSTDARTGSPRLMYSDGTSWRRVSDDTVWNG